MRAAHRASRAALARRGAQRGLALVCALMLLLAAMVIGVSVVRGAFALMAAARHEAERIVARAAAEAALRDAERDIVGTGAAGADAQRVARFAAADGAGFVEGCGRGASDRGLCRLSLPPAWESIDLAAAPDELVPYGRYTGAALAAGSGGLPARLPGYLIERLEPAGANPTHGSFYRITAIGFGIRASTQVVLQAIYRRPAAGGEGGDAEPDSDGAPDGAAGPEDAGPGDPGGPGAPSGPGGPAAPAAPDGPGAGGPGPPATPPQATLRAGRLGWREIANWPELHARAQP